MAQGRRNVKNLGGDNLDPILWALSVPTLGPPDWNRVNTYSRQKLMGTTSN